MPASEDTSKNLWVRWAVADPQAATQFWQHYQTEVPGNWTGARYLSAAQDYLWDHESRVSLRDLEAFAGRTIEARR